MSHDLMLKPEGKLADAELEMVIGVIRRGLVEGDRIEELERRILVLVGSITEAKKRLIALNRIGQEVCRSYQRAIDPQRKQGLTAAEAIERVKWIQDKSDELKRQFE